MIYKNKRNQIRVIPDPINPIIIDLVRVIPDPLKPIFVDLVGENFVDVLKAKDIGEGGLSVYVPHQFTGCKIDHEIELVITLPKIRSFKASGLIRHKGEKQGFYFGIAFTHIEEKDLIKLRDYIKTRAEQGMIVK